MANMLFAFIGPYASGKTTMVSQLMSMGINYVPTYTTNAFNRRETSRKILYRTIKKEDFKTTEYMAQSSYQGELYGLKTQDIQAALQSRRISIAVLQPSGIRQLTKFIKKNLVTIYLMADDVSLVDRMLHMGFTNDEIKYHLEYAEANKEFDTWKTTDFVVKNIGNPRTALDQILSILGLVTLLPQDDFNKLIK